MAAPAGDFGGNPPASVASPRPWRIVLPHPSQRGRFIRIVDASGKTVLFSLERNASNEVVANYKMIVVAVNACFGDKLQTSGEADIEPETRSGVAEASAPQFTIHEPDGDRVVDPRRIGA